MRWGRDNVDEDNFDDDDDDGDDDDDDDDGDDDYDDANYGGDIDECENDVVMVTMTKQVSSYDHI